jgi:outer membrane protein TolC
MLQYSDSERSRAALDRAPPVIAARGLTKSFRVGDNELHALNAVDSEQLALGAASAARDAQRTGFEAGKSNLLPLLDAERSYQRARLGLARAQAQRLADTAQLFVAMGGGWWDAGVLKQP